MDERFTLDGVNPSLVEDACCGNVIACFDAECKEPIAWEPMALEEGEAERAAVMFIDEPTEEGEETCGDTAERGASGCGVSDEGVACDEGVVGDGEVG